MTEYIKREEVLELACHNILDVDYIMVIPAADVAPVVHGKCLLKQRGYSGKKCGTIKVCSVCGWENSCRYRYCPNCGAKMDLENA